MSDPTDQSAPATPANSRVPSRGILWTLAVLAVAAMGVAIFILGIDVAWMIKQRTSKVPFCSAFAWLDCETVLSHPRWSYIAGLPVAAPGALLYLMIFVMVIKLGRRRNERAVQRAWWWLHFAAGAIPVAAAWFIWLQVGVIGKLCQYCLIDHVIGITLTVLILLHGFHRRSTSGRGLIFGAAAAGLLIAGQLLIHPTMTRPLVVVEPVHDTGPYQEQGPPGRRIILADGQIVLNTTQHPLLGSPNAKHIIVEAVDFTCPHCLHAYEMFKKVMPQLGPDYAILVITFPLNPECNPQIPYPEKKHEIACFLARLAHALWLTDPDQYPAFHDYLFDHQDEMTRDMALDEAHHLVDRSRLEGMRVDQRIDAMLKRDIALVARLGFHRLPGILADRTILTDIGDDPNEIARQIRKAFGQ